MGGRERLEVEPAAFGGPGTAIDLEFFAATLDNSARERPLMGVQANEAEFRRIFEGEAGFVWRTLRNLGVPESDVDDVCQEVFLVVSRKLEEFEGRSTLRTWLYGIAIRVASEHRRRTGRRREAPATDRLEGVASANGPLEAYERREAWARLARMLDRLDEQKRAVFVLYEIEELTMKEVAEAIGCPLQTAYSRLHSARKQLLEDAGERRENLETALPLGLVRLFDDPSTPASLRESLQAARDETPSPGAKAWISEQALGEHPRRPALGAKLALAALAAAAIAALWWSSADHGPTAAGERQIVGAPPTRPVASVPKTRSFESVTAAIPTLVSTATAGVFPARTHRLEQTGPP